MSIATNLSVLILHFNFSRQILLFLLQTCFFTLPEEHCPIEQLILRFLFKKGILSAEIIDLCFTSPGYTQKVRANFIFVQSTNQCDFVIACASSFFLLCTHPFEKHFVTELVLIQPISWLSVTPGFQQDIGTGTSII